MNPKPELPSDSEIDRLLGARIQRTSPEFEMRWRKLRAHWSDNNRQAHRSAWPRWLLWPGLATAGIAAVLAVRALREPPTPPAAPGPVPFEELFALDAALAPAAPLLNAENRDAVIHLSAQSKL
jgi:hypothetical protein